MQRKILLLILLFAFCIFSSFIPKTNPQQTGPIFHEVVMDYSTFQNYVSRPGFIYFNFYHSAIGLDRSFGLKCQAFNDKQEEIGRSFNLPDHSNQNHTLPLTSTPIINDVYLQLEKDTIDAHPPKKDVDLIFVPFQYREENGVRTRYIGYHVNQEIDGQYQLLYTINPCPPRTCRL